MPVLLERRQTSLPSRTERRISPSEKLQVRERIRQERLPLFIIRDDERNLRVAKYWKIPGTDVRVSPQGDIYYPVWRERTRVLEPELYASCSKLPPGWTLERLLNSKRRPISEVVFVQVSKDQGAVETAIRAMDHVLGQFQEKGRELQQVGLLEGQIDRTIRVLQETETVPREEFEEGFSVLYQQTLDLLEKGGMRRARLALKKDIEGLLEEASRGTDKLGRRNPVAMMRKLQAAAKRVSFRRNEAGFIVSKFEAMKAGLTAQREKDRKILETAKHDLSIGFAGHDAFKHSGARVTGMQKGILIGQIGSLVYSLEHVRVKPYKPAAVGAIEELRRAQELVRTDNYQEASAVFKGVLGEASQVLEEFDVSQGKQSGVLFSRA